MSKLGSILSESRLETWSHVSEDTKKWLSQVPWILEKVQEQDKDAQALQGAGVWSAGEGHTGAHDQSDAASISLEPGIPEFSLRRTDSSWPSIKNTPIGEVLGEVRNWVKIIEVCLPVKWRFSRGSTQYC
jgi:hypothetical protein